jgi:hypothetical protein
MNKKKLIIGMAMMAALTLTVWADNQGASNNEFSWCNDCQAVIDSVDPDALRDAEISGLLLMREEEKLARDVYKYLGERWNLRVFSNIANSEQTHMDQMAYLLEA